MSLPLFNDLQIRGFSSLLSFIFLSRFPRKNLTMAITSNEMKNLAAHLEAGAQNDDDLNVKPVQVVEDE